MPSSKSIKEVQRLNRRIAALSRFISKSSDHCVSFFKALKGKKDFEWTPECEDAFQRLKTYLASPPVLSKPQTGDSLYLYLSVSDHAVCSVLIRNDGREQRPVYYVSRALLDAKTRYSYIEKLALALVSAARKLRAYFHCHKIIVMFSYPLRATLHNPDTAGRMMKWAVELGEYGLEYQPRTTIKSQVLADFVAEFTGTTQGLESEPIRDDELEEPITSDPPVEPSITTPTKVSNEPQQTSVPEKPSTDMGKDPPPSWTLFVDGSSNEFRSGAGIVLTDPNGLKLEQSVRFGFQASNNEAEYEALLAGLRLAKAVGADRLEARSDSQLVVNQIKGDYAAKDEKMIAYLSKVTEMINGFVHFEIQQLPRSANRQADALANLGSKTEEELCRKISVEFLAEPSIDTAPPAEVHVHEIVNESVASWMDPILDYILHGTQPINKAEARRLRAVVARYTIVDGKLFKRSYTGPLLRCLADNEALQVLTEIHEGHCGNHSGGRTLAHKAMS